MTYRFLFDIRIFLIGPSPPQEQTQVSALTNGSRLLVFVSIRILSTFSVFGLKIRNIWWISDLFFFCTIC